MTFQPWHQNQTFSESLKLIVLWNLITIYKFFLSFEYWLGPTCNIILAFRLGLAWLGFFLEIKRLGLAWFGFFWCSFGLAWLGLEYFYHMKAWLGLACSEKTRLDDPYSTHSLLPPQQIIMVNGCSLSMFNSLRTEAESDVKCQREGRE